VLGLVIKYSQKLSQPVVDRLKKRVEALYSGPENAGRDADPRRGRPT